MHSVIIYHLENSERHTRNLEYFINFGIFNNPDYTYILVTENNHYLLDELKYDNLFIIINQNSANNVLKLALVYYWEYIKKTSSYIDSSYIFISSHSIGPFVPSYLDEDWVFYLTSLLTQKKCLIILGSYPFNISGINNSISYCFNVSGIKMIIKNNYLINDNIYQMFREEKLEVGTVWSQVDIVSGLSYDDEYFRLSIDDSLNIFDKMFISCTEKNNEYISYLTYQLIKQKHKDDYFYASYRSNQLCIEVTSQVITNFYYNGVLIINPDCNFRNYFTNIKDCISSTESRTLIIKAGKKNYILNEGHNKPLTIILDPKVMSNNFSLCKMNPYIIIVLTIHIDKDNVHDWKTVIFNTIIQFINSGIMNLSRLHVYIVSEDFYCLNCLSSKIFDIKELHENIFIDLLYLRFEHIVDNTGFRLLAELGKMYPKSLFLYSYLRVGDNLSTELDCVIFQEIIYPWKKIIRIFNENTYINKVGLGASSSGFFWHNSWWVRGSYLIKCKEPNVEVDYNDCYRNWITFGSENSTNNMGYLECYSLISNRVDYYKENELNEKIKSIVIREKNIS